MNRKILWIAFWALLIIPVISRGQVNGNQQVIIDDFKKQLSADVAGDNLHGCISVAILKHDRMIWSGAFGYARMDQDIPADTGTIFRLCSITKCFTATLLMQLVEEGKLKLDDPVENYLPEIKNLQGYADAGKITFRQLASHTSGLKREPDMPGASVGGPDVWQSKVLACITNTSFEGKPGQQFIYSNIGFAILGLALERAAGTPFIQMVQERILKPLHMNSTYFLVPDDKMDRLAQGLDNRNGTINTALPLKEARGVGYRIPNGGLYSTPTDLAKLVMSMMGTDPLLKAKSYRQMQDIPSGGKNYGLGLMIVPNSKVDIIGHNGSDPGYTTQFDIEQGSGYAVILMRNYNIGNTNLGKVSVELLKQLKQAE